MKFKLKKRTIYIYSFIGILIILYLLIPIPYFNDPTCTVIESYEGKLLGAKIADDGQWRFPQRDSIPEKFKKSITLFEDKYFYYHPGFNPVSLMRAAIKNIKAGKIISGGSTITMQVVRLSRKGKPRTYFEKLIEIIIATKLELKYSKDEILTLYASNAPFGGNVVGIDAASWRYYGRPPENLSWSEVTTLAVLPNAPALIYPGKNSAILLKKRNDLLLQLFKKEIIDSLTYKLATIEPLPGKPKILPQIAPHLLTEVLKNNKGKRIKTTIKYSIQKQLNQIIQNHQKRLKFNEIYNAAAIIIEVESGNIIGYTGNTNYPENPEHGCDVDIIQSARSTGSIMKPILYAAMLNDGEILPSTLIADIPTQMSGFTPKNYNLSYDGAVPAKKALARSLNIPSVRMLHQHGVQKFRDLLINLGLTTLIYPAGHYGLTLILGGAEATLWDLSGIYASLARILNHFVKYHGKYYPSDIRYPNYIFNEIIKFNSEKNYEKESILSAASIWFTFEALKEVNRPEEEQGWDYFSSSEKVAWKTGTSFGFRDAWAIGTTPEYVVGVWAGNADGEGRPGLTGISSAAPIMFDIFDYLELREWFEPPYDEFKQVAICKKSGYLASYICDEIDTVEIPENGIRTDPCPYHFTIHLDKQKKYRVNVNCENSIDIIHQSWFILPPAMEWYYKRKNPLYKPLPPYRQDCIENESIKMMEFIYPKFSNQIYVPVELDGKLSETVFEIAHRNSNAILYWHLDEEYIGSTTNIHQKGLRPEEGKHTITVVDNEGNYISKKFIILRKDD